MKRQPRGASAVGSAGCLRKCLTLREAAVGAHLHDVNASTVGSMGADIGKSGGGPAGGPSGRSGDGEHASPGDLPIQIGSWRCGSFETRWDGDEPQTGYNAKGIGSK